MIPDSIPNLCLNVLHSWVQTLGLCLLLHCKYTGPPTYNSVLDDPLLLQSRVHEPCLPNYIGMRIPVPTNLNISNWRRFLVDYWDDQLVDLLEFGFLLDFDRSMKLILVEDNHKSAKECEDYCRRSLIMVLF